MFSKYLEEPRDELARITRNLHKAPQDCFLITIGPLLPLNWYLFGRRMAASSSQEINMGNGVAPDPFIEQLKNNIVFYGNELLKPCGSTKELLEKLDKLGYFLSKTKQAYKELFEVALKLSKNVLIADEFIRHAEMEVRVSVASCISEIIRIFAPGDPYDEDQLREFFQLAVSAFESLSCISGRAYKDAVYILRNISYSQACVLMLDLQLHDLVHQMFHLFFNSIRTSHSNDIFSNMENIMTLIIRNDVDNDESALELAKILLAHLKKENQNISPVAFRLAENTLKNCSNDLKPYLLEAGGCLEFPLEDYAEVVVSLYRDAPQSEDMTTSQCCDKPEDVRSPIQQPKVQPENVPIREKRSRKPISLMKLEEGYDALWMLGSCASMRNINYENKKRKKIGHPQNISEEAHLSSKRVGEQSSLITQKANMITGHSIEKQGSLSQTRVEQKRRGKNIVSEDLTVDIIAKNHLENRQGSSAKVASAKKSNSKTVISEDQTEDVPIKTSTSTSRSISSKGEAQSGELSNPLDESKSTSSKQEASKRRNAGTCLGDELIGCRVKVWWPLDEMFYEGKITFFYHSNKKHKVAYDDGDTEILDLAEECWELIDG